MKNIFFNIFIIFISSYLAFALFVYKQQREIMYTPITEIAVPEDWGADAAQIIKVKTQDNIELTGWYFPPNDNSGIIVYFHGNGQHIGSTLWGVSQLLDDGYGLLMVEYREYAGNHGKVTELGLYKDSRAFVSWLNKEKNIQFSDMIFFGESLGSALAVEMALDYSVQALVLFASFSSVLDMAEEQYTYLPVSLILKDKYLSNEKISKIKNTAVLVVHGGKDSIVEIKFGKKLYVAAKEPKEFIEIENGTHINLYELGAIDMVRDFLKRTKLENY